LSRNFMIMKDFRPPSIRYKSLRDLMEKL